MTVIVVEDDRALASTIIDYLEIENIVCDYASDGVNALDLIRANSYQVIVLDINLPRIDGLHVCKQLRASGNTTPIIMLTAKDKLDDKLNGFRAGTDDYLVKPFAMDELVARIRALSGRVSGQTTKISVGDLTLDLDQNIASRGERVLKLSPTAFKLLEILMRASPRVVSKQVLIHSVWGDNDTEVNNLKVHIHHIRKQVDQPEQAPLVHTIKPSGYVVKPAYEN
ncbi:response regulator transcription factor [Microbulbifer spongiae]|uniref:Response regulator transcription factor n=1 Tax=Microbulbifer spongiae TaxID=2944933 RepID=A0ABY9EF79_9GAMM|nr:response regulator transcription factor [Microbulbifer sp. MI-G]WKD50179.1 response regulator transcription factor [Microbulbifer sp. MI-G]